ncbi:hypothetical protein JHK84_048477 [Glycine max]|nr:hypothetical protein JHK84_048477 [Glycine max]
MANRSCTRSVNASSPLPPITPFQCSTEPSGSPSDAESQHEDYNEFKSNEDKDDNQYKKEEKKRKKKKLSEENKGKEYNEFENNEVEDDGQGRRMKKKKLRDKSKNNSEFNSNEGDVNEVDDQCKKMKTKKKAMADIGESPNPAHSGSSKPKRVTFSDQVDVCCDGLIPGKRSHPEIRDYWKEIGTVLPQRPYVSVYTRAHILLERGKNREWTPEEKWWNQMVQYIGEHGGKSFAEQVEILAKRFCPDLLEVREAFDAKPVIC